MKWIAFFLNKKLRNRDNFFLCGAREVQLHGLLEYNLSIDTMPVTACWMATNLLDCWLQMRSKTATKVKCMKCRATKAKKCVELSFSSTLSPLAVAIRNENPNFAISSLFRASREKESLLKAEQWWKQHYVTNNVKERGVQLDRHR